MICDGLVLDGPKTFTLFKIELVGEQREERRNREMKYK